MPALPNIGPVHRFVYVVGGAAMMAWGFFWATEQWTRVALAAVGGVTLLAGAIGF